MAGKGVRTLAAARRHAGQLARIGEELVQTAGKSGEMAVAAAQTIGYRTAMMLDAIGDAEAMRDPEFTLMGSEKVDAALAAGEAVVTGMWALGTAWATWVDGQSRATTRAVRDFGRCRTPVDVVEAQVRYVENSMVAALAAGGRLAQAASRLPGAGLAPVHRAASANARRLGKK